MTRNLTPLIRQWASEHHPSYKHSYILKSRESLTPQEIADHCELMESALMAVQKLLHEDKVDVASDLLRRVLASIRSDS